MRFNVRSSIWDSATNQGNNSIGNYPGSSTAFTSILAKGADTYTLYATVGESGSGEITVINLVIVKAP
jgi:hypothetical protein